MKRFLSGLLASSILFSTVAPTMTASAYTRPSAIEEEPVMLDMQETPLPFTQETLHEDGLQARSTDTSNIVITGKCGDNLTYLLRESGTLTISGTGEMDDYGYYSSFSTGHAPWAEYADSITTLVVEEGVTSIGRGVFGFDTLSSSYENLLSIDLPYTLTTINAYNFSVPSIDLPPNVTSVSQQSLQATNSVILSEGLTRLPAGLLHNSIEYLYIPPSVTYMDVATFTNYAQIAQIFSVELCPNLTIYCHANSYAEAVCQDINIPYVIVEESPSKYVSSSTQARTTPLGEVGMSSTTQGYQNYGVKSLTPNANLVETSSGYLRIEKISGTDHMVLEYYNDQFQLTETATVDLELTTFVAFHEGVDHYYMMFTQTNASEDNNLEVVRVVKYDKDWNRLSATSISGINTVSGVSHADMAEADGNLLVHTQHTMYASSDGYNHQANLRFTIDMDSMTLLNQASNTSNSGTGYVSHSFHQLVDVSSDGFVVTADHGDAYPRSLALFKWSSNNIVTPNPTMAAALSIEGTIGNNTTKARFGGLQVSTTSALLAGSSVTQNSSFASNTDYNVFVTATPRDSFSTANTTINWITNYDGTTSYASNPYLVELTEEKFILIWNELSSGDTSSLRWTTIDQDGNQVGTIYKGTADMSSVEPKVNSEGNIVWFSTYNSAPVFYTLNLSNNTVSSVDSSILDLDDNTPEVDPDEPPDVDPEETPDVDPEETPDSTLPDNDSATIPVEGVGLMPMFGCVTDLWQIPVKGSWQLLPVVVPTNATNQGVTFSSSDPSIATVSSTGLVTAVSEGTVYITVTTTEGNYSLSISIGIYGEESSTNYLSCYLNDGSSNPVSVELDADYTPLYLTTPEREGYTFLGWFTEEDGGSHVTTDSIFPYGYKVSLAYAHWSEKTVENTTYSITLNTNGGESEYTSLTSSVLNNTLPNLPKATRENYTFTGWYSSLTGGTQVTTDTIITEDTTLYARWVSGNPDTKKTFVTLNPNGGTFDGSTLDSIALQTTIGNNLSSLPTPYREGYTFKEWKPESSSDFTDMIHSGSTFTTDTNIYAYWIEHSPPEYDPFHISFQTNGGVFNFGFYGLWETHGCSTFSDGTAMLILMPTRIGFTFDGWYTSLTGGTQVDNSTIFTQDTTVFARWSETVEEDPDISVTGVTLSMSALGLTVGNTSTLTATVAPSNATNKNVTWSSSNTSVATVSPSGVVTGVSAGTATITVTTADGSKTSSCTVTVTAAATTTYTILFNGNGGSVTTLSGTTGTNGTLSSLPTPTRTGYSFNGWYTTATGGSQVTTSTVFGENTSIYAQWTLDNSPPYTISFSAMGGTASESTMETGDNGKLSSLPTATRSGYEFQGWFTLSSGGTQITTSTVFEGNSIVLAQWKLETTDDEEDTDTDDDTQEDTDTEDDTQEDTDTEDDTEDDTDTRPSGNQVTLSSSAGTVSLSQTTTGTGAKVVIHITVYPNNLIEQVEAYDLNGNEVKVYLDLANDCYYFYQPSTDVDIEIFLRNLSTNPFTSSYYDVSTSAWHNQYISYLTKYGIMSESSGIFYPETDADRGTIAQALLTMSGESASAHATSGLNFTDINGSSYQSAVTWCSSRGIMSGYNDTIFGTTDKLTREQFATTLCTFAKTMGLSGVATTNGLSWFQDVSSISYWATDSIAWCVENDLMAGFDGYLKPQDTLSRAELATMLCTFHKMFVA